MFSYFQKAIDLWEELSLDHPESWLPELAKTCFVFANYLRFDLDDFEEEESKWRADLSEKNYSRARGILKVLSGQKPELYLAEYSYVTYDMAFFMESTKQYDKLAQVLKESVSSLIQMAELSWSNINVMEGLLPKWDGEELFYWYYQHTDNLNKEGYTQDARELYSLMLAMYRKMPDKAKEQHFRLIDQIYYDLAFSWWSEDETKKAIRCLFDYQAEYKTLLFKQEHRKELMYVKLLLGNCYWELGNLPDTIQAYLHTEKLCNEIISASMQKGFSEWAVQIEKAKLSVRLVLRKN